MFTWIADFVGGIFAKGRDSKKETPLPPRYLTVMLQTGARRYLGPAPAAMYAHRVTSRGDLIIVVTDPWGDTVVESFAAGQWKRCGWMCEIEFQLANGNTAALFKKEP